MINRRRYIDAHQRVLFVDYGIGIRFGTFYRKPNGALKRLVSPALPMRETEAEAQADLDAYAHHSGLEEYFD